MLQGPPFYWKNGPPKGTLHPSAPYPHKTAETPTLSPGSTGSRHVQGHQPPQCDGLAVWRHHVHGGGHHCHVAELHGSDEWIGAFADIEAKAEDGLGGLCDLEELVNGEIQVGLVRIELGNIARVLEAEVVILLVEAIEAFVGVVVAKDRVVREGGGEGVSREGCWGNGFVWGLGKATAVGVTATNNCCHFKKNECTTAVIVKTTVVASLLFITVGSTAVPELLVY